jgi:uncharacterized protein
VGLLKSGINEVIATTSFNAAPMGIHVRDGKITMVLFRGSTTAGNVERDGWVVANFIHDPVMYVTTAFGDLARKDFTEEVVNGRKMQRLSSAEAWVAFSASVERTTKEALIIGLRTETELIEEVVIHPVNRGFGSIIDATVHATRFVVTRDPELKKLIDYHAGIVRKCGGKREMEALGFLLGYCNTTNND